MVLIVSGAAGVIVVFAEALMHHCRIHVIPAISPTGYSTRTMQLIRESYDDGYNTCVMELLQLVGPAGGSMDAVVQHLERSVQQRNRESSLRSNVETRFYTSLAAGITSTFEPGFGIIL